MDVNTCSEPNRIASVYWVNLKVPDFRALFPKLWASHYCREIYNVDRQDMLKSFCFFPSVYEARALLMQMGGAAPFSEKKSIPPLLKTLQ